MTISTTQPIATHAQADEHAAEWVAAWNRRDLDAVLKHYVEDCRFVSPKAVLLMGQAVIVGKEALRAYWQHALARVPDLRFTLDRALWDPQRRELVVVYEAELNGRKSRACELMTFDAAGRQLAGEALYGAAL